MQINVPTKFIPAPQSEPEIGDVYRIGPKPGWHQVICGLTENTVYLLTFDGDGQICGCQRYGHQYIRGKSKVGHCAELSEMSLSVEWFYE